MQDITVEQGQCAAVLPTSARLSDQQGHLHAGCYCSLVDLISTTALASAESRTAVSVAISVDFYAPLAIDQELVIESRMVKAGKTLTFAEVDFRYVDQTSSKQICAYMLEISWSSAFNICPVPDVTVSASCWLRMIACLMRMHQVMLDGNTTVAIVSAIVASLCTM